MDLTGLGKLLCIKSPWILKEVKVQSSITIWTPSWAHTICILHALLT
jgi:hypothetical protein